MNTQPILTSEGYKKLIDELDLLKTKTRQEIAQRIEYAKNLGDLSENAEYAAAREEQAFVEGRILEYEDLLKNAMVVKPARDATIVNIGNRVITECQGKQFEFRIVGANESNPQEGLISNESPLGKVLIGARAGQTVAVDTPRGRSEYTVKRIIS